jgi:trehalose 6-phosphate synthase
MRLTLRFVLPLLVALVAFAYAVVPIADRLTLRWFVRDLDIRATLIASAVQEPLQEIVAALDSRRRMLDYFGRIAQDERLFAIGWCERATGEPIHTGNLPTNLGCANTERFDDPEAQVVKSPRGPLHVAVKTIPIGEREGRLLLVHDMAFIERRSAETRRHLLIAIAALGLAVSLLTVTIAQLSWRGWVLGIHALLRGEGLIRQPAADVELPEFRPVARDLRRLIANLRTENRPRDESQTVWSAESLRAILHDELRGEDVIVVSNREPYMHVHREGAIVTQRPASGLVTALEPIMRACSGTWIAHGSGSADREVVDSEDRVAVPPGHPSYRIRRIWLTEEEEKGYYFGFANEGLWPLCHIAHVRPVFRSSDWERYVTVNRKFARAVVTESTTRNPIVLVQDYHFALLPQMIREALPDSIVITFWHIPWPNPESFGICPWRSEILAGMLGSTILGFHTQFHCNNFVDTVDRTLEARVDREAFTVTHGGRDTAVRRYPISVAWPPEPELIARPIAECREAVRDRHGLPADHLIAIGVDRLDYTKGILERMRAVERLLELRPEWVGRFSLLQIAAPTRSSLEEYQSHEAQVRALAARINERFAGRGPDPVVLLVRHFESPEVYEYFRAAELCFVSSLHDGMNLVAKEFVSARTDVDGVLVLSQFTGAARELPEALIVNPYDSDQCAAALHLALTMPPDERHDRMRAMRGLVGEFNVYRWAGRMLLDAAAMRRRGRTLGADGRTA